MANTKIESQMDFYKTDNLVLERKRSTKTKPESNHFQEEQEMSKSAPHAHNLSEPAGLLKEPMDQKESPMIQRREQQNRQNSVNLGQYTTDQSFTEAGVTLLDSEAPAFDRPLSSNINRITNRQAVGSLVKLECIEEVQQVEKISQKSQVEEEKHIVEQDTPPNEQQACIGLKDRDVPLDNIMETDKNSDRNEDLEFYENDHQLLEDYHNENQLHQIDELLSQELSASHQLSSRLHNIHNNKTTNFDLPMDSARSYAKLHTDSIVESQKVDKIRSDSVVDTKAMQLDMPINKMMRQTEICNSSPFDNNDAYSPIKQELITEVNEKVDFNNQINIQMVQQERELVKPKFFLDLTKCSPQPAQQNIIVNTESNDAIENSQSESSLTDSNQSDDDQNQKDYDDGEFMANNQQKEEENKHSLGSFIDEQALQDEMIDQERQEPEEPFDSQSSEGDYSSESSQLMQQEQENDQQSEVARILDSSEDQNDGKGSTLSQNDNKSEASGNGAALNRSGSFGLNKSGLLTPTALRHRSILYTQGKTTPQATLNKPSGLRPPSTTRIPQALQQPPTFESSLKNLVKKNVCAAKLSPPSVTKIPVSPPKLIRRMTTLQLQKQTSLTDTKRKSLLPSPKSQLKKQSSIFSNSPAVGRMSVGNKLTSPSQQQSIKPLVASSPAHRRNTSFQLPASPASHSLITNSLELFRAQKKTGGVQPQQTKVVPQENDLAQDEDEETSLEKEQEVDEMVIDYIRNNKLKVPIERIEGSKYLFGTKVIIASILNGGLNVRVGGGFMTIDQFVTQHSGAESFKLRVMASQEKKKVPKIMQELTEKYKQNKKQFVQ